MQFWATIANITGVTITAIAWIGEAYMANNVELTDFSYLQEMSADEGLIREMIQLFLANTPESIDKMKQHLQENDFEALASEAHKMKPTINYMGVHSLENTIKSIESMAKQQVEAHRISELLEDMERVCDQVYAELNMKLSRLNGES